MKNNCKGGKPIDIRSLIHVVQPVDQVEKGECGGKYYPWPSIDGVHVCEVRNFDFELRRTSAQPRLLQLRIPVQTVACRFWSCCALLSILDPWVIKYHWCWVSGLADAGGDLVPGHLVVDLKGGQKDISLGVHLQEQAIQVTACIYKTKIFVFISNNSNYV